LPGAINRLVPMDEASIDGLTSFINVEIVLWSRVLQRARIVGTQ
jgi:hypothetical protein